MTKFIPDPNHDPEFSGRITGYYRELSQPGTVDGKPAIIYYRFGEAECRYDDGTEKPLDELDYENCEVEVLIDTED